MKADLVRGKKQKTKLIGVESFSATLTAGRKGRVLLAEARIQPRWNSLTTKTSPIKSALEKNPLERSPPPLRPRFNAWRSKRGWPAQPQTFIFHRVKRIDWGWRSAITWLKMRRMVWAWKLQRNGMAKDLKAICYLFRMKGFSWPQTRPIYPQKIFHAAFNIMFHPG